jgi:hypothetical protein
MAESTLHLTDAELIARLTMTEDSFIERKSQSDRNGWLRTVVAFANSTPIGLPAVLFVGVSDDGVISANVDVERALQTFSDYVDAHVWPPIFTLPRTLNYQGNSCVAVIVPGSSERPHFAGRSFVRVGTQTKDASDQQFESLISDRNSMAYNIKKWMGKSVFVMVQGTFFYNPHFVAQEMTVSDCNSFYVTPRASEEPRTASLLPARTDHHLVCARQEHARPGSAG